MFDASLAWLCLWLFLDGATISVFSTPLLLHYGHLESPWRVALFGGVASALGSALQLMMLRWILAARRPWMGRLAPARSRVEDALRDHPSASFLALAVARATPLPDAPLKLVAAATRYPIPLYLIAILIGSLPYYFALALIGHVFRFPLWLLAAGAGVVLLALLIVRLRRRSGP